MSLKDTILQLNQLIPILATLSGNPQIGILAQQLIVIANGQLESQAAASGKSTEEILQEASAKWDKALLNAQALKDM
ncbi:MAG: hypothetical protein M3R67_05950 [Acidobacteriota bacterium]|nr:hypothetical protein [Acidobacteriota bacterium]